MREAADWFDNVAISETDRQQIGNPMDTVRTWRFTRNLAGISGCQVRAWQADGRGPSGDLAQNGINREDEPAAGTMITKTFFLM
jgi:hypothetical protein